MNGVPAKRKLLKELASLTHSQRMRRMALLGRDHAGTKTFRKLLDGLDDGLYEWQLRLTAAEAARESSDVIEGLRHPLPSVRAIAARSLRLVDVDSAVLRDLLMGAATAQRGEIYSSIRALGRTDLADELLGPVTDRYGAAEAGALLPACSESVVRNALPGLSHAVRNWSVVARRHPVVFTDFVSETMSQSRLNRPVWWQVFHPGISALVALDPDSVLDLWQRFAEPDATPSPIEASLRRLFSARPDRTLKLLLEPARRSPQVGPGIGNHVFTLRRHLPKASDALLVDLTRVLIVIQPFVLARAFSRLAPSRRTRIFSDATADMDLSSVVWPHDFLAVLPHEIRAVETRRMLQLPAAIDNEAARHELLPMLPIDETWEELQQATTASDAALRGAAWGRLVKAVQYSRDPEYFDRLLDELQRMKNEQEPVRVAAYKALSACPPSLITIHHMGRLLRLAQFLVEAGDASRLTSSAITDLFQRVLKDSATDAQRSRLEASVNGLEILSRDRGSLPLGFLEPGLPRGGERILFDALRSRIESETRAGRYRLLFTMVRALGRRSNNLPELQQMLESAIRNAGTSEASRAIRLWLATPGERSSRLEELITWDSSTALVDPVFQLLTLVRQDLLDVVFSRNGTSGRFATSSVNLVPLTATGFHRWTPSQWKRYRKLVAAVANNESVSWHRMLAIRTLCRIPGTDRGLIAGFLTMGDTVLTEATLRGLAWTDDPGAELETMASHAGDDHARVAMYAATRAARFAAPPDVDRVMRSIVLSDDAKLTSRKEALRILGANRPPAALQTFADVWARRPLHRDLLIALASALRSFPNEVLAWEVLTAMSTGSDDEALALVRSAEFHAWPDDKRPRLAALVAPLIRRNNSNLRNAAWPMLAGWRQWYPEVDGLILEAIADLDVVGRWRPALAELQEINRADEAPNLMLEVVQELAARPDPEDADAGALRDNPRAQRLHAIARSAPRTPGTRTACGEAADVLLAMGRSVEAGQFAVAAIDWRNPAEGLVKLAAVAEGPQHDELIAPAIVEALPAAMHAERDQWLDADLLTPARQLADGTEPSARMAATFVAIGGPAKNWPAPWRELLMELRDHVAPAVRVAARTTFTASE